MNKEEIGELIADGAAQAKRVDSDALSYFRKLGFTVDDEEFFKTFVRVAMQGYVDNLLAGDVNAAIACALSAGCYMQACGVAVVKPGLATEIISAYMTDKKLPVGIPS